MLSDERLRSELYDILEDILAIDRDEIMPSSQFFADLGGESIDLLELSFHCQKHFGINVAFEKMFTSTELEVTDRNELTQETMATMKAKLPFLDIQSFGEDPKLDHIQQLLTVEAIYQYLKLTLASVKPKATH
ncbi:MAG: acyl carrier protein [Phycisphaerae bacterium]